MDLEKDVILWIIRLIFAGMMLILATILWAHLRRIRYVVKHAVAPLPEPELIEQLQEFVVVRLDALPGREFNAERVYDKLKSLGLTFNDYAFDYTDETLGKAIFSVFNKRNDNKLPEDYTVLRNFDGLLFVMRLPIGDGSHQCKYFATLLAILDELRKHLNANVCNEFGTRLKDHDLQAYQERIEAFEQRYGEHLAQAYRD